MEAQTKLHGFQVSEEFAETAAHLFVLCREALARLFLLLEGGSLRRRSLGHLFSFVLPCPELLQRFGQRAPHLGAAPFRILEGFHFLPEARPQGLDLLRQTLHLLLTSEEREFALLSRSTPDESVGANEKTLFREEGNALAGMRQRGLDRLSRAVHDSHLTQP